MQKKTFQQRRQEFIQHLQETCKPKDEETGADSLDLSPEIDPQLWKEVDQKYRDLFGGNSAT